MSIVRRLSSGVKRFGRFLSADENIQAPIVQALTLPYNLNDIFNIGNIYDACDGIVDWDADIQGILSRLSHMCKMSYNGVSIVAGKELAPQEEDLLEFAKETADRLDFEAQLMSIAFDLTKYGDVVKHLVWNVNDGVTELQNLPRTQLTAIENRSQLGTNMEIHKAGVYVLNESSVGQEIFDAKTCVHIPLNNKSSMVYDLRNRVTFSVWSKAPMLSLLSTMKWKLNSVVNDILWTHRNVPREHHKLDLSMYTPERYSGTPEQRVAAAETAALAAAKAYHTNMQNMKSDVGYVTDNKTEITYVEPKSTNYQAPNEKIAQINESISNCLGLAPIIRDQSFAAALISGSFAVMQALSIAKIAARSLEQVLRKSIEVQYGPRFNEQDRKKIKLRLRLVLEKDRSEVMRQIAIMVDANSVMPTFTPTEIRNEWGLEALSTEQVEEIRYYMKMAKEISGGGGNVDIGASFPTVGREAQRGRDTIRNPIDNWPSYPSEEGKRDELKKRGR